MNNQQKKQPVKKTPISSALPKNSSAEQPHLYYTQLLETLYQFSLAISNQTHLPTLLHQIVEQAATLLGTELGALYLLNPEQNVLELAAGYHQPDDYMGRQIPPGYGISGYVFKTGETVQINQYNQWDKSPLVDSATAIGRMVCVPLKYQNRIMGVLNVADKLPGDFSADMVHALNLFAAQAAIAIENANQLATRQQQYQLSEALRKIGSEITAVLDFDAVVERVLSQISGIAPYDSASFMLIEGDSCRIIAARGYEQFAPAPSGTLINLTFKIATFKSLRWIVENQQPLIIANTGTFDGWVDLEHTHHIQSWAGIPVFIQGKIAAIFSLDKAICNFYQPYHLEYLLAFSSLASTALHNAQLFEQTKNSLNQTRSLYQVSRSLIAVTDLPTMLQTIVDEVRNSVQADRATLIIIDLEQRQVLDYVKSTINAADIDIVSFAELLEGLTGWVIQNRQPAYSPQEPPDPREAPYVQHRRRDGGSGSIIVAPLIYRDQVLGTMTAIKHIGKPDFQLTDVDLMMAMTNHAAVAIKNYRLFAETNRRSQHLATLNSLAAELTGILNINHLCNTVTQRLQTEFDYFNVSIFLADAQSRQMVLQSNAGHYDALIITGQYYQSFDQGILGQAVTTGQPVVVNNTSLNQDVIYLPGIYFKSELAIPIKTVQQVLGVLNIDSDHYNAFAPDDVATMITVADQLAVAFEKTRLFEEIKQQAIENAHLHQETEKQARQMQKVLDTVQQGIILLDNRQQLQLANPAAKNYLSLVATINQNKILTHLGTDPLPTLLQQIKPGRWYELNVSARTERVFKATIQPIMAGFSIDGWVIVLREVTEDRKIQQRIQQQDRLAAVGQLAAGIAHDFNNILTGIIGFADLLSTRKDIPESAKKNLQHIIKQGQRAAQLIRQILDFSRQSFIEKQAMNLGPFLEETIKLLQRTIPETIQIITKIDQSDDYFIKGDSTQLQQVLTNLAVNARDAMPQGGTLTINLLKITLSETDPLPTPEMSPGLWICLSVADTGIGIPSQILPHIFEPFFTTKDVGVGTGLGLAQVYGIVKQHQGYITVTSKLDFGTTFSIYLPFLTKVPEVLPAATIAAMPLPRGTGQTLLLVEDEDSVLQATSAMLEHLGYTVLTAVDGNSALSVFNRHQSEISLVLTDMAMPQMDGLALIGTLHQRYPNLQTIILSGYPLDETNPKLQAFNVAACLQKPLNLKQLANTVYRVINKSH